MNAAPDPVDVSIVVPTYREAENLRALVPQIAAAMGATGRSYEVVIVDDDSRDGTEAVVAELSGWHPVRLITRTDERGLSSAVVRGFAESRGARLVCMDADLSHPPAVLGAMLAVLDEPEVDFVLGSRYVAGASTDQAWGLGRWINSRVATLLARPFTTVRDPMSGFFALPRAVYERAADLNPIGYKIGLELIVRGKCRNVREIPIHFADRQHGESKLSLGEQLRYVRHLRRLAAYKFGLWWQFAQMGFIGALVVAVWWLVRR